MRTYSFPEMQPKTPGPWSTEPDKAQWIDTVTDLDCLIVRNHMGNLCGYVGVQPGHKWHGTPYHEIEEDLRVHGGLTFSDFCAEGEGTEEGPFICHIPAPGRPANVWWLGFDCGHHMDVSPLMEERLGEMMKSLDDVQAEIDREKNLPSYLRKTYRTFEYVQQECASLALQIHKVA